MKKKTIIYLVSLLLVFPAFCQRTKNTEKVSLEIIDTNSQVVNYEIDWPFPPGPKPVGGETSIINVVNGILSDNNIDCPPKHHPNAANCMLLLLITDDVEGSLVLLLSDNEINSCWIVRIAACILHCNVGRCINIDNDDKEIQVIYVKQ